MARGQPFNIRLDTRTERFVEDEARRTKRSRSAVVEAFTEEAVRTRRFPGIAFRGDGAQRRPWVIGAGLDVWEIIQSLDEAGSMEALVANLPLTVAQVRLAIAYRDEYPAEVEDAIIENRLSNEDLRTLFPFIEIVAAP